LLSISNIRVVTGRDAGATAFSFSCAGEFGMLLNVRLGGQRVARQCARQEACSSMQAILLRVATLSSIQEPLEASAVREVEQSFDLALGDGGLNSCKRFVRNLDRPCDLALLVYGRSADPFHLVRMPPVAVNTNGWQGLSPVV
jgi:hypothetical protein